MNDKRNIFQQKPFVVLFAVLSAITWAFAFPLIKLGFNAFEIADFDTGAKTLFAGVRFFLAGILTIFIALFSKRSFKIDGGGRSVALLCLYSLVNTTFHYFFFYIGLSNLSGSRSSIIDSLSTFFLIILACIIFKDEHFTLKKCVGCLLGFGGILVINISLGGNNSAFSLSGDGMLFMSALCSAFGGVLTRVVTKKMDPLAATGISLALGGAVMIVTGIAMGGALTSITPFGILILILLVLVSAIGFSLYNKLISCNPVGEVAIFNSLIPVFGALLSCIILGEPFYARYSAAAVLVMAGIYIINKKDK